MSFFQDVSFKNAGGDLFTYLRRKRRHNWLFWLAACIPPAIVVFMFQMDVTNKSVPPPPPPIYFESWPADRPLEETLRVQAELKAKRDKIAAEKREAYRALGRATGLDVDRLEREGKAELAEREKALKAEKAQETAQQKDSAP